MALESDLIALDEPTAGLDEANITQLVIAMSQVLAVMGVQWYSSATILIFVRRIPIASYSSKPA
jgi:ABC-type branched-subunit amino acid transport system ATPase component